jgi:CubicO group peptidase (beta-lactamase class C family)
MKLLQLLIFLFAFNLVSLSQNKVEMLDSLFNTMHERGQFSGNVLVVNNGGELYRKSFGYANRNQQINLDENTLFNTGSVSKTFTAVAILQLGEKGKLDVDDFANKYLPDFSYDRITIGHLLTHASGLPAKDTLLKSFSDKDIVTNAQLLKILYDQKPELQFSPGSKSLFNDVGYIVLAEIVEAVSKQEFTEYLDKNIFNPAGMGSTRIYNAVQIPSEVKAAKGYLFSPFTQEYVEAIKFPEFGKLYTESGTEGDANIWSTTGDLVRFCGAISEETLLTEEALSTMFLKKTDALMPGQDRSYGKSFSYGWIIPDAPYRIAEARGEIPGFNAQIVWNLSEKRMIIYLSNNYLSFTSYNNMIPYSVGAILTRDTLTIPKKWASVELTNVVLHISDTQIKSLVEKLKGDTETYDFDVPGVQYLIRRLREMGKTEKADLIESLI